MRRAAQLSLVCTAILAGCGDDAAETPAACLGGAEDYLTALEAAPGEVRLAGTTPISACFVDGQEAGPLADVGEQVVEAAKQLNRRARRDPAGESTVELGYLVGAVQEGASTTGGIHQDLVVRLDSAARFAKGKAPTPAFLRTFGEGYAAGQASG